MKTRKIKRLYNNLASLRDHEVEKYIQAGGVKLTCNGDSMTLSPATLRAGFSITSRLHESRYPGSKPYRLIDYRWRSDKLGPDLFSEGKI